jgi:hypothetical protein
MKSSFYFESKIKQTKATKKKKGKNTLREEKKIWNRKIKIIRDLRRKRKLTFQYIYL